MGFWRKNDKPMISIGGFSRTDIALHTVSSFAGSTRREPMAVFEYAPLGDSPNTVAVDPGARELASGLNVSISIRDAGGGFRTIHIGRIRSKSIMASSSGEAVVYESRFDDSFADVIGSPLLENRNHKPFWNDEPFLAYVPQIVFNPRYQDEVYGNRHEKTGRLILPQSMVLSQPAKWKKWKLYEAVTWLCSYLIDPNAGLPGLVQQVDVSAIDTFLEIETTTLDAGTSLADSLTKLLRPYGYDWHYEFPFTNTAKVVVQKTSGEGINGIRYYTNRFRAAVNDQIDLVESFEIHESESETYERVAVVGDSRLVEITDTLIPGWDRTLDSTTAKDLIWDSEAMQDDDRLRDVWRKWVPEHPELQSKYIGGNSNESKKFRRKLLPTLTTDQSGKPMGQFKGVHVTYEEVKSEGSGVLEKQAIPIMSADGRSGMQGCGNIEILDDEGAIRFVGREVPLPLKKYGYAGGKKTNDLYTIILSVTCCIDTYQYKAEGKSLDGNLILDASGPKTGLTYVVHAPQRFQHVTYETGSLKSEFSSQSPEVKCNNILKTLNRITDTLFLKAIEGRISYHGLDNVSTRNLLGKSMIYCRQRHLLRGFDRYPVVVGWTLNFDNQTTNIQIGSYRD